MTSDNDRPIPASTVAELFWRAFGEHPHRVDRAYPPLRVPSGSERALLWSAPNSEAAIAAIDGGADGTNTAESVVRAWCALAVGQSGVVARSEVLADAWEGANDGECWVARTHRNLLAIWGPTRWWDRLLAPVPAPGTVISVTFALPEDVVSGVLCPTSASELSIVARQGRTTRHGTLILAPHPQIRWGNSAPPLAGARAQFDARVGETDGAGSTTVALATSGVVITDTAQLRGTAEWVTHAGLIAIRVTPAGRSDREFVQADNEVQTRPPQDATHDDDATQHLSRDAVAQLLSGR